jgi:sporulation protein YlmC with PRC-barrel domain
MSMNRWVTGLAVVALVACDLAAQDSKVMQGSLVRGSQIAGKEVRGSDQQPIGTIEDVVLDRNTGSVAFVVVSFAPAMNKGDKLIAIPWTAVKASNDAASGAFVASVAKDRLDSAPTFDRNAWPDMNSDWSNKVYAFYGTRPSMTPRDATVQEGQNRDLHRDHDMAKARERGQDDGRNDARADRRQDDGMRADGMRREVTVVRGRVKTFEQGDPAQLVVTSDAGEVRAELAPRSFLDQQRLTFDANSDVTLHGFYETRAGQRTFVVTEVTGRDGRVVRLRREDASPLWERGTTAYDRPQTGYDRPQGDRVNDRPTNLELVDLSGTVTYVEPAGECNESPQGRLAYVRTDRGERIIALGPGAYLARNRWDLRPSDTIAVRGYETNRDGRRVFMATEVRRGSETWRLRREDGTPLW